MELKPKEKVKIDNYKAQYNSILGNISNANKTLEETINKVVSSRLELTSLYISLAGKSKELQDTEIVFNEINSTIKTLNKKVEELRIKEKEIKDNELKSIARMNAIKCAFEEEIRLIDSVCEEKIRERRELEKDIIESEETLDIVLSKVISNTYEFNELESGLVKIKEEILENRIRTQKELDVQYEMLAEMKERIREEQIKIELPILALKEEEKRLESKEKNLNILIDRFKRYMKVYFPNQEIKL